MSYTQKSQAQWDADRAASKAKAAKAADKATRELAEAKANAALAPLGLKVTGIEKVKAEKPADSTTETPTGTPVQSITPADVGGAVVLPAPAAPVVAPKAKSSKAKTTPKAVG